MKNSALSQLITVSGPKSTSSHFISVELSAQVCYERESRESRPGGETTRTLDLPSLKTKLQVRESPKSPYIV